MWCLYCIVEFFVRCVFIVFLLKVNMFELNNSFDIWFEVIVVGGVDIENWNWYFSVFDIVVYILLSFWNIDSK